MKIAICLSGQARCFDYHCTHDLLFPGHDVDYFCFFWDYFLSAGDEEKIREVYDPVALKIATPPDFTSFVDRVRGCGPRTWNTFPMWLAVREADALRASHESASGFTYDAVVRSRTDNFFNPEDGSWCEALEDLEEGDIVLPTAYHFTDWQGLPGYNDQLALGTSASMTVYSGMFSWFPIAFDIYPGYWGIERLLLLYIEWHNSHRLPAVNVRKVGIDYKLLRPSEKGVPYSACRGYMNPAEVGIRA